MKTILICLILIILFSSSASALDGSRKGFLLGGGFGISPNSKWSTAGNEKPGGGFDLFSNSKVHLSEYDEFGMGAAINLLLGYSWDGYDMIVLEGNFSVYDSRKYPLRIINQGFRGISWYRYYGDQGESTFTILGIGQYFFNLEGVFSDNKPKTGYLIGAGYQFAKHIQVAAYLNGGQTSFSDLEFGHQSLNVIVTAIAF